MQLAVLVVGRRVKLQLRLDSLIVDYRRLALGKRTHHQINDVEQLAPVATAILKEGGGLLHPDVALLEHEVLAESLVHQRAQVIVRQRLEHIHLTATEQRSDDLKRGILRRGTDKRHYAALHSREQRVLLTLAEAVNLVDKQYGRRRIEERVLRSLVNHIPHILHAAAHGAQRIERGAHSRGNDVRQRSLAHTGRAPHDKRAHMLVVYHAPEGTALSHQVLLPHIVLQGQRPHTLC